MAAFGTMRGLLERVAPPWLSREWATKLLVGLIGYTGDALMESGLLGLRSSWPLDGPVDGVGLAGSDRKIPRYPPDTDDGYRERVQIAHTTHQYAGSKNGTGGVGEGLEGQIRLLGYPNVTTKADYEWTVDALSGVWQSRFWVLIPFGDHGWQDDGKWDEPGVYDDGGVWDLTATPEEIRALRQTIRHWKSGHEICANIIALGELWDFPVGLWSDPGNWDDEPAILISAT